MRILIILMVLLSFACKNKKKVAADKEPMAVEKAESKPVMEKEPAATPKKVKQNIDFPQNAVARIQRTPCFGRCPIYTLTVYNNGTAELKAENFLDRQGDFTATVDQEKYQKLLQKAEEINYFSLDNEYNSESVTDLPSTITTLRQGDQLKQIVNRYQGPEALNEFEKYFDELYLEVDWQERE